MTCELLQSISKLFGQVKYLCIVYVFVIDCTARSFVLRKPGWTSEALECFAPKPLGLREILFLQPADVIAVRLGTGPPRLVLPAESLVSIAYVFHDERHAPAVEQNMMEAPDEFASVVVNPNQGETH